eukprot:gene34710-44891_t
MSDDRFYATYEEAVLEIHTPKPPSFLSSNGYHATLPRPKIYTYKSVLSLLWSLIEISLTVLIPFLMIFVSLTRISSFRSNNTPQKPDGSAITAGLYYRREMNSSSAQILNTSSLLNSPCLIRSGLPGLPSTPWMLNGDLRTLFPYAFFRPVDVRTRYIRRWVRVHLADNDPIREKALKEANVCFEAVAVDHSPATTSPGKESGVAVQALLVLAGLTGGSSEGYVMDLVQHANAQGFDCFVMIGRGLAGVPFHGARTEDLVTVGQVIRSFLPPGSKLFAVGLSLGGIIVSSAMAKGPRQPDLPRLAQVVDGAVSISGCFDSMSNIAFRHSREVWQPILRINSVLDFDSIMVTRLNGFRSVAEYYHHLTATDDQILSSPHNCQGGGNLTLEKPLLALHAMDDVIIHPNTMPSAACSAAVDNLICLVTDTGGHVGWPVGLLPTEHRWLFQNSIIIDFCKTLCALQQ